MEKEKTLFKVFALTVAVLASVIVIIALVMELQALTSERRQPLSIDVSETESPFSVSDRHDDTRSWIEERLEQD